MVDDEQSSSESDAGDENYGAMWDEDSSEESIDVVGHVVAYVKTVVLMVLAGLMFFGILYGLTVGVGESGIEGVLRVWVSYGYI